MDAPPGPKLLQQAEKILLHPIHPQLISYCPSMDLIALVTDEENLDVYRINGQRAFGLKRKSEYVVVEALKWQWNGAGLAVAWSDGCVDVLGVETGKVVHGNIKLPPPRDGDESTVSCLGWGLNFIDAERVKKRTGESQSGKGSAKKDLSNLTTEDWDAFKDETNLEDFLQRQPDFASLDIAPDLPDRLAVMDTESLLPKLPVIPLPPANPMMRFMRQPVDSGAFSAQAEVDGLLHSQHLRDHNSVDMFLRFSEEGSVHPSIYDSMEAVDVRLPRGWNLQSKVVMHASHPYACTHSLLMETRSPANTQKKIAWVPLTLGFIPSAGIYLHLIAAKTAQLQNLLSYLSHTLNRIHTYFKQAQDLPGKFMMNISETLEEHKEGNLVQNLYHLACTGHCPPLIHEWLVDELGEQGHKRWDNAVTSGLAIVIQLLHENFLPALDRCSIIISRLKGLAEFRDRDWIFSGPLTDFTALLDVLKTMRLLANTTLLYAADEKRYFNSFSKWLKYSFEFEATEPGSQSRTEMESQPAGVDIGIVLEYIQYGMSKSDVQPYLTSAKEIPGEATDYDDTRKAIELLRGGGKYKAEALCLEKVLLQFGGGVRNLLKQVSQWQENNISMDSGIVLGEGDVGAPLDMRMVSEPNIDAISTYIALPTATTPSQSLTIHRHTHDPRISSLPSSLRASFTTALKAVSHGILDAKFADDSTLLLLLQSTDAAKTCSIVSLAYTPAGNESLATKADQVVAYSPIPSSTIKSAMLPAGHALSSSAHHTIELSAEMVSKHTRHVFEGRFTPLRLVVNGRKGRRVVVVLGSDKKHYRVLDLDFTEKRGGEKGEGEEESSDEDNDVEMGGA
ncbi:uncharacterized protein CC84DRAFT_1262620 [Paraphaeosphaeria sporulosa]|uniref:Anaphase-promoting complex subunit 4 n=1 Tax=Paraphaeosphaeria sporulosa TaxID=1460663 RepID=A0A177C2B0_9PLEO|nr:uncharacterized protein CC84DRAFT_1262620 [Paraphaeosphaeria sporulosa]OAG01575.1 hypothetical protein CC84DRAFT_1262620 [Paraphaeosphaeria sporulosa]